MKSFSVHGVFMLLTILAALTSCTPNPPELIAPVDGSVNTPQAPDLKWNPSEKATSYELEILADSGVIMNEKGIKTESYTVQPGRLFPFSVYYWRVKASNFAGTSDWSEKRSFVTLAISGDAFSFLSENDSDGDGISDEIENNLLRTDPNKKTLFVRPKKEIEPNQFVYWSEFIELFSGGKPGFANIPPFAEAGIEIVVIGNDDPRFPYEPMRRFEYNPARDPNQPPCNILEIIYSIGIFCSYGAHHSGHTFFTGNVWSWDTLGYTLKSSSNRRFSLPRIYSLAIDNYLREGAYHEINIDRDADLLDCVSGNCDKRSPMNLNDLEQGPPYTQNPDETAEFNKIFFDDRGKITLIGTTGKKYTRDEVLKRVIVHEMGHAILSGDIRDHCDNPTCIMYQWTESWETLDFGLAAANHCQHEPGGRQDIRAKGVIYNTID
jgi:hypothetical protein